MWPEEWETLGKYVGLDKEIKIFRIEEESGHVSYISAPGRTFLCAFRLSTFHYKQRKPPPSYNLPMVSKISEENFFLLGQICAKNAVMSGKTPRRRHWQISKTPRCTCAKWQKRTRCSQVVRRPLLSSTRLRSQQGKIPTSLRYWSACSSLCLAWICHPRTTHLSSISSLVSAIGQLWFFLNPKKTRVFVASNAVRNSVTPTKCFQVLHERFLLCWTEVSHDIRTLSWRVFEMDFLFCVLKVTGKRKNSEPSQQTEKAMKLDPSRRSTRHRRVRGDVEVKVSSTQTLRDLKVKVIFLQFCRRNDGIILKMTFLTQCHNSNSCFLGRARLQAETGVMYVSSLSLSPWTVTPHLGRDAPAPTQAGPPTWPDHVRGFRLWGARPLRWRSEHLLKVMEVFSATPMDQHLWLNGQELKGHDNLLGELGVVPGAVLMLKV